MELPALSRARSRALVALVLLCAMGPTRAFVPRLPPPRALQPMPASGALNRPIRTVATRRSISPLNTETLTMPPPEQVLKAVEKAGGRVTAQDVAALAGVDLTTAQKGLVKLASLVEGDLEVSKEGDLVYNFPNNFRAVLRTASTSQRVKELWLKLWPGLFYALRVSFGMVLVLSIVLIFTTIAFAGSASVNTGGDRDDRRRDDRRAEFGAMRPSLFFNFNPFDFFIYRPYGFYYYQNPYGVTRGGDDERMGFLESCWSYIFGDGDPNAWIDEQRYKLIAQVIRRNGGAVIAEQLAPYLDAPAPEDPNAYAFSGANSLSGAVDESFVLPVLTRLNGRPEVTRDGSIIYVFPDLMTSAVEGGAMDARASRRLEVEIEMVKYQSLGDSDVRQLLKDLDVPESDCFTRGQLLDRVRSYLLSIPSPSLTTAEFLEEKPVPFSVAPTMYKLFAGALGVLNLGGAIALGNVLKSYTAISAGQALPGLLGLSQALYVPLLGYAVAFNVIPLARSFWLKEKNAEIERRNQSRQGWARVLGRAVGPLYEKILAARNYRSELKVIRKGQDVVYTTTKSAADQAVAGEMRDMQEFDKRFKP